MTLSNPVLGKPVHPLAIDGGAIHPRECRQMVDLLCQPSRAPITLPAAETLVRSAATRGRGDQSHSRDGWVGDPQLHGSPH